MIECYLDDCFNGMKKIEDKKIDCVLTDPPYGINYQSWWTKKFDKIHNDKTVFDLDYFFNELNRITKDDSAFYIYVGIQTLDLFLYEVKKIDGVLSPEVRNCSKSSKPFIFGTFISKIYKS